MRKVMLLSLSLFFGLTLTVTAAMAWGPGLGRSFGMGQEFGCPDLPILGEKQFYKVEALQEAFLKEIELLQAPPAGWPRFRWHYRLLQAALQAM